MAEKKQKKDIKKKVKRPSKKAVESIGETENVNEFMLKLRHPLKVEIEAVRSIILNSDARIKERVKWNAPSFFYKTDMVTFNPRNKKAVHLVFHHADIIKIKSPLLEGDYTNRRMAYLISMAQVKAANSELKKIMKELVRHDEK